jgi:hypothetical protein
MPRSEREQRLLQEIEQALSTEDPRLARSIRSASATTAVGPPGAGVGIAVGDRELCSSSGHAGVSSWRAGQSKTCMGRHAGGGQLTQRVRNSGLLHRLDGYAWPD